MCPAFDRLSFTEEVKDITLRYLKKKKSFQFLKDKLGGKFCQSTRGSITSFCKLTKWCKGVVPSSYTPRDKKGAVQRDSKLENSVLI